MKYSGNKLLDTKSSFYSNLDRLVTIIKTTIDRGQINNAEKYLKYFFEVFIKFYSKLPEIKNDARIDNNIPVTRKTSQNIPSEISDILTRFERREIVRGYNSFFDDKIDMLLYNNIQSGSFRIFRFTFSLFKDSIITLSKSDKSRQSAFRFLYHISLVTSKLISSDSKLDNYEKGWYYDEVIEWFISAYNDMVDDVEKLHVVQREMLHVLKLFIDNNRHETFKKFMNRLSSAIFHIGRVDFYEVERIFFDVINDDARFRIQKLINASKHIISAKEYVDAMYTFDNDFREILAQENIIIENHYVEPFLVEIKEEIFNSFKENYLKVLITRALVYSLFKGKSKYLKIVTKYHQPDDADAIWAGTDYGMMDYWSLRFLVLHQEEIIGHDVFFWIDHHGFEVYLNTLIAYYLIDAYKKNKNRIISLNSNTDKHRDLLILHHTLKNIKSTYNFKILSKIISGIDKQEVNEILNSYIDNLKYLEEQADYNVRSNLELDEAIIEKFKAFFIKRFYDNSSIRRIFKVKNSIEYLESSSEQNEIGINTYIDKRLLSSQDDILFEPRDFSGTYADSLINYENTFLIKQIEKRCNKAELTLDEFISFIRINKSNYDLLICKGKSIAYTRVEPLIFTQSWSITESPYKDNIDYSGILDNHYHTFYLRNFKSGDFIFIDSKKMGKINQYKPQSFEGGKLQDIFSFSFIDLNKDTELTQSHLFETRDPQITGEYLRQRAWLRIYESLSYENSLQNIGIIVTIKP